MTQEKNEPCYVQNHEAKRIETKFEIDGNTFEITQRRLTGGEVERHLDNMKNVYTDKDVYLTLLKQNELDLELQKLQRKAKKGEEVIVPIDDATKFLIYKGKVAISNHNRKLNAQFIAYSCNDSETRGGKFLFNGKKVSEERKINIINELGKADEDKNVDYFELLLANANRLSYPTEQEKDNAKS
ncbi:MAG: hypothetical protein GY928_37490 [Colwellia sp.]|nr:hypothetical protein [Colwellia sp.]